MCMMHQAGSSVSLSKVESIARVPEEYAYDIPLTMGFGRKVFSVHNHVGHLSLGRSMSRRCRFRPPIPALQRRKNWIIHEVPRYGEDPDYSELRYSRSGSTLFPQ